MQVTGTPIRMEESELVFRILGLASGGLSTLQGRQLAADEHVPDSRAKRPGMEPRRAARCGTTSRTTGRPGARTTTSWGTAARACARSSRARRRPRRTCSSTPWPPVRRAPSAHGCRFSSDAWYPKHPEILCITQHGLRAVTAIISEAHFKGYAGLRRILKHVPRQEHSVPLTLLDWYVASLLVFSATYASPHTSSACSSRRYDGDGHGGGVHAPHGHGRVALPPRHGAR